jgi:hemolysin III
MKTSYHQLMSTEPEFTQKPRLRGYLHQEAFFVALGACALLLTKSSNVTTLVSCIVYSLGLLSLFGISAVYHRFYWKPGPRALLKKLDHSAIFILIACSFTPFCLLALPKKDGDQLLLIIWFSAIVGILQSVFWVSAPKWFTALFYVIVGCIALPYLNELRESLGLENVSLLLAGGMSYTLGAVFYATKRPQLFPKVFGYHELFHLLTIVGAIFHFAVIYRMIV